MTYLALYIAFIFSTWWIYRVGWTEAIKKIVSILIPSICIIFFNVNAGRLLFRNPILGIISFLPSTVFLYKVSQPLVFKINSWIDRKVNDFSASKDIIETEVIYKEEA